MSKKIKIYFLSVIFLVSAFFLTLPLASSAATFCVRHDGTATFTRSVSNITSDVAHGGYVKVQTSGAVAVPAGDYITLRGVGTTGQDINGTHQVIFNDSGTPNRLLTIDVPYVSGTGVTGGYILPSGSTTDSAVGLTNDAGHCLGLVASFNNAHASTPFLPGDIIYFGGALSTTALYTITDSGSAGNPITFTSFPGAMPAIDNTAGVILNITSGVSYININNFIGTTTSAGSQAVKFNGNNSYVTISSSTLAVGGGNTGSIIQSNGTDVHDITISDIVGNGGAVSFATGSPQSIYLNNVNITGGTSMAFDGVSSTTLINVSHASTTGFGLQILNGLGKLTIDNYVGGSSTDKGVYILNSTFDSGSQLINSSVSFSSSSAYYLSNVEGLSLSNNVSSDAKGHAFVILGSRDLSFTSNTVNVPSNFPAGSYGFYVVSSSDNINFSSNTVNNAIGAGASYSVDGSSNISFNGDSVGLTSTTTSFSISSSTGVSLRNISVSNGGSMAFSSSSALTIDNVSSVDSLGYGMTIVNSVGTTSINNLNISSSTLAGLYVATSTFSGSTNKVSNSTISTPGTYSYFLDNVSGLSLEDNSSVNPVSHAFIISSSTNISLTRNTATGGARGITSTVGYYVISTSSNITFNSNISNSARSSGFVVKDGSNNITFNSDLAENSVDLTGFSFSESSNLITCNSCIARNNGDDGFSTTDFAHDITFNKCLAYGNGSSTVDSSGDGFTSHKENYNILINNSLAYDNWDSGFGMSGSSTSVNSSGRIYNSVAATTRGGSRQMAGMLFSTQGLNSTTNEGWTVKNNIGYKNNNNTGLGYTPHEIATFNSTALSSGRVALDYNVYKPLSDDTFSMVGVAPSPFVSKTWAEHSVYEPHSVNASTSQIFVSASPSTTTDFRLADLSPAIDAGDSSIVTSTTTDYLGNPLYGAPDAGAFEYQPTLTITTTDPQYTGNIRIYADGKYRYTSATSSATSANFLVTPVSGSYTSYGASTTRPEYLNVTFNTWETTGSQNKSWTASSSMAGDTTYTIGDLVPNTPYTFKLDGTANTAITSSACSGSTCTSDSAGQIVFTYTGGYSTHTFELVNATVPATETAPVHRSSGGTVANQISNLISMGNLELANELSAKYNLGTSSAAKASSTLRYSFTRNLKTGSTGSDVKLLQQFLNTHGFILAKSGAGSPGRETSYFGQATRNALIRFQKANKITPAVGYFGPVTRGVVERIK
ncbi:MAG: peptidoglycan-binding protein [Candidatus Paceibacterota bacterium]